MENSTQEKVSTMKVGSKYGAISGLAGIALFLVAVMMNINPFQGASNWIGIGISIVLLVLAQKNFKDSGDGYMSYGQGFGVGLWYTIVSSVLSLLVMYVYMNFIDTAAMEKVFEQQELQMEEQGQSTEAIQVAMEWTRKLFWAFAVGGSIFFGIIIALVVTIFTQKKNAEPGF